MGKLAKNLLVVLAAVALVTAPAHAQHKGRGGKRAASDQQTTEEKKKKSDAAEHDYKAAIDRLPDKPYDPWRNVR